MSVEHHKANLGNLGEEFLDKDPQQGSGVETYWTLRDGLGNDELNATEDDELPNVDFPADYSDDILIGDEGDEVGPLSTEFLPPAPGQMLNADDEPGGMYGSTADELLGSSGPDAQDLGSTEGDFSRLMQTFNGLDAEGQLVAVQSGNNLTTESLEDTLSTDLPVGGTSVVSKPILDPATGELTDYDEDAE